jgi:uncharacterized protein (TIGR03083 family)
VAGAGAHQLVLPKAEQRLAALDVQGRLLLDAAEAAGLETAVPSCPGWTVATLVRHIGLVHAWASDVVEVAGPEVDQDAYDKAFDVPDDVIGWARSMHHRLVATLTAAQDYDGWTLFPMDLSTKDFWIRRQLHETAVHRMDAELAAGRTLTPMGEDLAADGIDELLVGLLPYTRLWDDEPATIAIRLETGFAWYVSIVAGPPSLGDPSDSPDLTLTGDADSLYAAVENRSYGGVRIGGDPRLLELWRRAVQISR